MKKNKMLAACLVMVFLAACFACGKEEKKPPKEKTVNVKAQKVKKDLVSPTIESVGTLHPFDEVTVTAELEGVLKDVRVDESSPVAEGTLLAVIDDTDYALEVRRAGAALAQAKATLENTRLEHERKKALLAEKLIPVQQHDDVRTRLATARAAVDGAQAALLLAQQNLKKTRVESPIAGVVKSRKVSAGDYTRRGNPLLVLIQNDPLKLLFSVTEKDVGRLKIGQKVSFTVDSHPGREFAGAVTLLYPDLDERTRTLLVEAQAPNGDEALKPGMFARVRLLTDKPVETVVVPVTALLYEGDQVTAFVVEKGVARRRVLVTGEKFGESMAIESGLAEGESLVVVGQQNLSEGVKVHVAL